MSLWVEIKRRNVVKVGIAYITLAWIVIEVTSLAIPALSLSPSLNGIVFYLGMIGFPFALFFAWAFEMTPDGIKKTQSINPEDSITNITSKKLEHIIVGLLSIAVIVLIWENYIRTPEVQETAPIEIAEEILAIDEPPSIAVLPFVNMSDDKQQEYFSDGISEEILNVLAKIPNLHVTSRSSAFAFKGKDLDLKQVAMQLGVNHILEGSVRKAGNKVRITAQLIEANSDRHIWSETYDRELIDIFAIQDEISDAIVIVLKEKLMGDDEEIPLQLNDIAKTNPEAYTAHLQALHLWKNGQNDEDRIKAIKLAEQSVALDENYAPSQALLSAIISARTTIAYIPLEIGIPLARKHAARAIELDPNYEIGYVARANIKEAFDYDFQGAREDLEHAARLNPNNSTVLASLSMNSTLFGNFEQALIEARKSISLDPLNVYARTREARVLTYMGDDENAIKTVDMALNIYPNSQGMFLYKGYMLINLKRFEEALELTSRINDEAFRPQIQSMAHFGLGDMAASEEALETLIRDAADDSAYQIAEVYGHRGNIENCLKWLDIAYNQRDTGLQNIVVSRFLESVRGEAEYIALVEKIGLTPLQ